MAYYTRPDEDIGAQAIAITGSAEEPVSPATNLIDKNPAKSAKLTTPDGWFLFEYAAKVIPVALALIYQYLDQGLSVTIQANDTDVWTSPAFEQSVTIPAKRRDGPAYQPWTLNVLTVLDAFDDPDGYIFWRILFGTNSQNIIVGRAWWVEQLHPIDLMHVDSQMPERDLPTNIIDFTELRSRLVTPIGGPQRSLTTALIGTDLDAGSAPIVDAENFRFLWESTDGGDHPFLFIPQLRGESDLEPWCADFVEPPDRGHSLGGYQVWPFTVMERSRGIPSDPP